MTRRRMEQPQGTSRLILVCSLSAAIFVGCGRGGPERAVVAGIVTYRSQTIADGLIRFIPCDKTTGPTMVAAIADGNYKVETWGGLPAGNYRVEIVAFQERLRPTPGEPATLAESELDSPRLQYLPAKYNAKTQLKLTVESGHRSLTHDFTLTE